MWFVFLHSLVSGSVGFFSFKFNSYSKPPLSKRWKVLMFQSFRLLPSTLDYPSRTKSRTWHNKERKTIMPHRNHQTSTNLKFYLSICTRSTLSRTLWGLIRPRNAEFVFGNFGHALDSLHPRIQFKSNQYFLSASILLKPFQTKSKLLMQWCRFDDNVFNKKQ